MAINLNALTSLPNGLSTSVVMLTGADTAILLDSSSGDMPSSTPNGLGITANFAGFGEVDFWNLNNNSGSSNSAQGFYFHQKDTNTTQFVIARLYFEPGLGMTNFDLIGPDGATKGMGFSIAPTYNLINSFQSMIVNYNSGIPFASRPTSAPALVTGMTVVFTDSNTNVWGATVAAGGANRVLAFYNGTVWTVVGK